MSDKPQKKTKQKKTRTRYLESRVRRKQVIDLILRGASRADVGKLIGSSHQAIANEMNHDEKFRVALEKAEGEFKLGLLSRVYGDPSIETVKWFLSKRYPKEFGKQVDEVRDDSALSEILLRLLQQKTSKESE